MRTLSNINFLVNMTMSYFKSQQENVFMEILLAP